MNAGTLITLVILVAIVALVAYMATSQSEIPTRLRRLLKQRVDDRGDETPRRGPRPRPRWAADPDRTNEAAEVEKVTGVIRSGEAFTIATSDPSFWEASGFDVEGLIVQVAEVQTVDVSGNFQFRYCVVEASGVERFAMIAFSQGCAVAVAYAARHPERVTHLVLYGGFARGWCRHGSAGVKRQMEALETLMREGWGRKNAAFRQVFTTALIPDATTEQAQAFNELQRRSSSGDNAARILRTINDFDVEHLLPQVRAPTLVLHCRGDSAQPFEQGRRLAAGIPGARFVALESRNHILMEGTPAWTRFAEEVRAFLASPQPAPAGAKC